MVDGPLYIKVKHENETMFGDKKKWGHAIFFFIIFSIIQFFIDLFSFVFSQIAAVSTSFALIKGFSITTLYPCWSFYISILSLINLEK